MGVVPCFLRRAWQRLISFEPGFYIESVQAKPACAGRVDVFQSEPVSRA